jgi:hypothetical protein
MLNRRSLQYRRIGPYSCSHSIKYSDSDFRLKGGQFKAYKYEGFWRAMDALRDRQALEEMVERGEMPWRANGPVNVKP